MNKQDTPNVKNWKVMLQNVASKEKAGILMRFFKTGKGEYGEGDIFIGIASPELKAVSKNFVKSEFSDIKVMINSPIHEHRMSAVAVLVEKYRKANVIEKEEIVQFYLDNHKNINNWDLVDLSAPKILGLFTLTGHEEILYKFSESDDLWEKRIAMVSTLTHIKKGKYDLALELCEKYLSDKRDLIQKVTGWMLREIGKKDEKLLTDFLDIHAKHMPRTALRYSIEKLHVEQRKKYMAMK